MLHAISWKDFLLSMGMSVLIYYAWLVVKYLPLRFLGGLAAKQDGTALPYAEWRTEEKKGNEKKDQKDAAPGGEEMSGDGKQLVLPLPAEQLELELKVEKSLGQLAMELDNELRPIYEQAEKGMKKEELLYAITLLLDKEVYHPLKGSHMQPRVSEGIFGGLLKHGSVRLDEGEMRGLWNR